MFYDAAKRVIDIVSATILIILFLPIWIIIPILIKLESPGPVFFFQNRIGKNGRIFKIIKFRSMIANADAYWKKNPALYEKFKKMGWKLTMNEDPRITRLGRVLRQISIDEFPQVFNVLKGDMSLVGPRPYRKIEVKDAIRRYGKKTEKDIQMSLAVKPGLTGYWQVSGRNVVPWNKRAVMEAEYAQRRNLLDDLVIILKTPLAMISKW